MDTKKTLPGYLPLIDAEEKYGFKADTLKKKCQRGEIIGAKKIGKTWFVPNLPGIDPQRTIPDNYPKLDFNNALLSNLALYNWEDELRQSTYYSHSQDVYIWEYGYYFFSLIFNHAKLDKSYLPFAVLISEAHTSLRCSFLLNLQGYHADSLALLRRTHECVIKSLAMRAAPNIIWQTGFGTGREKAEHVIGVNFKKPWNIASSFNHGNLMKLFEIGKGISNSSNDDVSVSYGPQYDKKYFVVAMNTSIFWLLILNQSLQYLFPNQVSSTWLESKDEASKLLKDYLVSKGVFLDEISMFENAIKNLEARQRKILI